MRWLRWVPVVLLAATLGTVAPDWTAPAAAAPNDSRFTAITPCRIVDTRKGGGALAPSGQRSYRVVGTGAAFAAQGGKAGGCGIPAGATAVEASISAVGPTGSTAGYLRAWPSDKAAPSATFLNYTRGVGITNTGTVGLSAGGATDLTVKNLGGTTHLVIDIQGYYSTATGSSTSVFVPITPCRVVDTRRGSGALKPKVSRSFVLTGSDARIAAQGGKAGGCGIPTTARAIEASVSAVGPTGAAGFLRAWPSDQAAPGATFLNYTRNVGITNTGTIGISSSGATDLTVKNFNGTTQVVVDVQGYFVESDPAASVFVPVTPCRVVDTRSGGGALAVNAQRSYVLAGSGAAFASQGGNVDGCAIPTTARAVEASVSAVGPTGAGFLRAWPAGEAAPSATFLNYTRGVGITNTGTVGVAVAGANDLTVKNFGGTTHLVIDVQGYYASAGSPAALVLNTPALARSVEGAAYPATTLTASGGTPPYTFSATGLPTGLTLSAAGSLTGTTTTAGTFKATLRVTDNAGVVTTAPRTIVVAPDVSDLDTVAVGELHSCAIVTGGKVKCWGQGLKGQLGLTSLPWSSKPTLVPGLTGAISISAGKEFTCALLSGGTVKCWGNSMQGALGAGIIGRSTTPVTVTGLTSVRAIDAGEDHACAVLDAGGVRCWGDNLDGQLGTGSMSPTRRDTPVAVAGITTARSISASDHHSCAVLADRTVRCWGTSYSGEVGFGPVSSVQTTPGTVVGLTNVAAVTTGGSFTCAETTSGTVRCWGYNGGGQLGNGTTTSSTTPVEIPGLTGVVAVRAGAISACAVLGSGAVRCWGSEYNGGLGDGGGLTDQLNSPTTLSGLTTVKSVAVGTSHTCAQLANSSARCWGRNYQMQLGTGDADPSGTGKDRASPAAVVGVP